MTATAATPSPAPLEPAAIIDALDALEPELTAELERTRARIAVARDARAVARSLAATLELAEQQRAELAAALELLNDGSTAANAPAPSDTPAPAPEPEPAPVVLAEAPELEPVAEPEPVGVKARRASSRRRAVIGPRYSGPASRFLPAPEITLAAYNVLMGREPGTPAPEPCGPPELAGQWLYGAKGQPKPSPELAAALFRAEDAARLRRLAGELESAAA